MDTNTPQEAMIRAAIKRTYPEETSSDFVADVMRKIKTSEITIYKPLISRKGWLGIALGVAVIMFGVFYFDNDIVLPELFDFKEISTYTLPDIFDKISLSKNMIYGIFFASVMILLQLPIITSRHYRGM